MDNNIDPIETILQALAFRGRTQSQDKNNPCPSDETFSTYMENRLSEEDALEVRSHINGCPDCGKVHSLWLEASRTEEPPVPVGLLKSAKSLVQPSLCHIAIKILGKAFEILNPDKVPILSAAKADLGLTRRVADNESNLYEVVDIKADIPCPKSVRVQHLEDTGSLKLSLFPSPGLSKEKMKKIRVELYSGITLIQSWPLYEAGTSMNPIEKGLYRISLIEIAPSLDKHQTRYLGSLEVDLLGGD